MFITIWIFDYDNDNDYDNDYGKRPDPPFDVG